MRKYKRLAVKLNIRIGEESAKVKDASLHSSASVYEHVKGYASADREVMLLVFLDTKNQLIDLEVHSIGCVDSSAVYPREVFRSALLKNASSLVMVHNHPSGDPDPSICDRELTRDIIQGGQFLGIKVLDHIILGSEGRYLSFADKGLIESIGREFSL